MGDTQCFALVRGSAIRVTGLDARGHLPPTLEYATSRSISRVSINETSEATTNEVITNEDDEKRLHIVKSGQITKFTVDIDFLRCDPGILSLVSGVPLVEDAKGDIVGFDAVTRLPAKSFAMELWSRVSQQQCVTDGEGFGIGPFGIGPFGVGPGQGFGRKWGYSVFPYLRGGWITGFEFSDGLVSFRLTGAATRRGSKWNFGPYNITGQLEDPTDVPIGYRTLVRQVILAAPPPIQTDGIQTVEYSGSL